MFEKFIGSLCLLTLAVMLISGRAMALSAGDTAPAFTVSDVNGTSHSLADYKDKIVVLEWMNPGCPFVQRHYREGTFVALANHYADQGVIWLAVHTAPESAIPADKEFAESNNIPYPVLMDNDGSLGKSFGAKTTPHVFVIGRDGKIIYSGGVDNDPAGEMISADREQYLAVALKAAVEGTKPSITEAKPYGCSVKYSE